MFYSDGKHSIVYSSIRSTRTPSIVFELNAAMAAIKMFQAVQKSYEFLGFCSSQSNQIRSCNKRILFFSSHSILFLMSLLGFVFIEAKTVQVP